VRPRNDGVALRVARKLAQVRQRFEATLAREEQLVQAHDNLVFALRMQGRQNLGASPSHCNRTVELGPGLSLACMHRGVLFMQQGEPARAGQELERLRELGSPRAAELERAIDGGAEGSGRGGIAAQCG
jgi:hypothetical protein